MAKKYNHEKQSRKDTKPKAEGFERKAPRLTPNSPNPDENRSYSKAGGLKKKMLAKKEKEESKKSRFFQKNDGVKFESRKRTDERTSTGDGSSRPVSGTSRSGFRPRTEEGRPFVKESSFKKREGFREKSAYSPEAGKRQDDDSWATEGRSRSSFNSRTEDRPPFEKGSGFKKKEDFREKDSYTSEGGSKKDEDGWVSAGKSRAGFNKPRTDDRPPFEKGSGFKKREDRPERGKDTRETGKNTRNNRADSGRRPRYNEDVMKSKLPVKVREKVVKQESKHTDGTIRLNRYIANAGICSRREADDLIAEGKVSVNGKVVTELGSRVMPEDTVTYNNKVLERENFVYVLLNKPKDFITTTDDPEERKTVMDIIAEAADERIYPVGRLDRKTTGLLLLTNDGKLAEKLSHPSGKISKIYQAELDKPISEEHFDAISAGFELEDGFIKPDELALITPDAEVVGIKIHSGKNRIVRRIFEHFGYKVQKLDRTVYAGLTKKELPRGKWRYLSEKEVIKLKYLT